ncbi:hypothetical protein J7F02_05895 [Streptomyces sp. ISL-112]|uniref:hypothetical protein n=1 Tax=unclassified Streptomyces TaxID=2593676 RepID=UPI001BE71C19|nr:MULTISPECIES: hypothetical protein [unclassified Streptomyces]MBT2425229.1 hypothetical protein [Streptomyces sp. ISL-112]MBT2462020.1 hypothetical protein [Streptomyces sp. ISL-63]
MTEQLTAEDVVGMSEWQINEARREGRLDDLTAQLSAPVSSARPYTVPTDPATGRPVPQLGAVEVKAMRPEEIVAAGKEGKLAAYAAGHDVPPPSPEVSAPAPVRFGFQFGEQHIEHMTAEEVAGYRAKGNFYDYDQAQAAGGAA